MILANRTILQSLLWVLALAIVVGIPAEIFLLGSDYLGTAAMLVVGAAYVSVLLRYARTRRQPTPQYGPIPMLPGETSLSNSSYRLRICRTENAQLLILSEAQLGLRAGLMALCPAGFLLVAPAAVIWATVSEPPMYWVLYLPIVALFVFLVWFGMAIVAANLLQNVWGATRLAFVGERLRWQITWRGRDWIDRSYRIGPAASVRSDLSNWFGVRIRGLEPEQPRPWRTRLLFIGPADRVNFGAALSPTDAQLVAAYIQQHLQSVRNPVPAEALMDGAGI